MNKTSSWDVILKHRFTVPGTKVCDLNVHLESLGFGPGSVISYERVDDDYFCSFCGRIEPDCECSDLDIMPEIGDN